jgi:hypothetical protein
MKLGAKRIRQLLIGILAVLSMSVSSVAACACSHHDEAPKEKLSCHSKPKPPHRKSHHASTKPAAGEGCDCAQLAPRASVKAEGFKLKKHASPFAKGFDLPVAEYTLDRYVTGSHSIHVYLTSIFLESSSSRGPPLS